MRFHGDLMITLEEIKKLPEPIQKEILDYAEYLVVKHKIKSSNQKESNWVDVSSRGRSSHEMASDTVVRMREEERW